MRRYTLMITLVLCVCAVAYAYREINFNNRWATGTYRVGTDSDGKLRASAITYILISHGVDDDTAGWAWFAGADTRYVGGNAFYSGTYDIRVKVRMFSRSSSGTYEGPTESDQYQHLHLGIYPPPQNGDGPDIEDCEAEASIDGTHPVTREENSASISIP